MMNPVLPLFTGSASNLGEEDILVIIVHSTQFIVSYVGLKFG